MNIDLTTEVVKAPTRVPAQFIKPTIFLAGSIEMGTAIDWQQQVIDALQDKCVVIYSPRRDYWDPTLEQSIGNPTFKEQVDWELDYINDADYVVFFFAPGTMSPISLLELGICTGNPTDVSVCCPEGFWRKGNVDIVCDRHNIPVFETIEELISDLIGKL